MDIKDVITDVAEKIQTNANVKAVFGEPYEKGNTTIIPVSRVSVCGCGCSGLGSCNADEEEKSTKRRGMGMGLHVKNVPVGYIEITNEGAHFEEIVEQKRIIMFGIGLGAFAIFSFTRLLMKLLKR